MSFRTKDARALVKAAGGGKKMQKGAANLMGAGAKAKKGDYAGAAKKGVKGTRA